MVLNRYSVRRVAVMTFIFTWSAMTILTVAGGIEVNCPDYSAIEYGLPFTWLYHELGGFGGPVNIWRVDFSALLIDLTFWLTPIAVSVVVLRSFTHLKRNQERVEDCATWCRGKRITTKPLALTLLVLTTTIATATTISAQTT